MKAVAFLAIITWSALLVERSSGNIVYGESEKKAFEKFKVDYDRHYLPDEEPIRKAIFVQNLRKIIAHNKLYEEGKSTFEMGINQFADRLSIEMPFGLITPKPSA